MTLGLQQFAWILREVCVELRRAPVVTFSWQSFVTDDPTLHLWEAFVSGTRQPVSANPHVDDATAAVNEFIWRSAVTPVQVKLSTDITAISPINLAAFACLSVGSVRRHVSSA